jgi:hypothetical protein
MERRVSYAWPALLVPIAAAFVLCAHWEPILRDSWGHYFEHVHIPMTSRRLWEFARDSYLHNNPRLGQTFTMLTFTPGPWHVLLAPILEMVLFIQLAALALGRWPSPRRTDDALVVAMIIALVACSAPQLGPMLFYRPFTGNYLFGFAVSLAFVLPYRFAVPFRFVVVEQRERGWWWIPIMVVAGAAAGLANEHTAPTAAAAACAATAAVWRHGTRPRAWMVAGIVGVIAGGIVLYVAPGQEVRYNGLATHEGLIERVTSRGIVADLGIVFLMGWYGWKMAFGLVLGLVAWLLGGRPRMHGGRSAAVIALAAFAIAVTLLASPKQGSRLYFASICLLATATAGVVAPLLVDWRTRIAAWLLAGAAIGYMLVECIQTYAVVGPEAAHRLAILEHASKGSVVQVVPYSLAKSRWFLGDDFAVDSQRERVAADFGLTAIELTGPVPGPVDEASGK